MEKNGKAGIDLAHMFTWGGQRSGQQKKQHINEKERRLPAILSFLLFLESVEKPMGFKAFMVKIK
ncbi:MAG: hypothetical protein E7243_15170 [Lacrimispora celerecrescens]|uniref:hypothetical protein n=1 Tax=Lacrimispora indolis TaxID=69825 RepID=UPI0012ECB1D9|nr:hypothetical protein [[Clostridium] methoxybenzovorans]MBE7720838.1 hypothetical protein [Lacrimispora celerecrescens]